MNNIFEEMSSSFKAKFCEFQHSSFLISFILSWIFINHKYIMIYNSNIKPSEKLLMLETQGICYLLPIIFALFYIFVYPYIAKVFYSRSLEFNNKFKETKINKLKKRLLDEDDAKSFINEIEKLTKKLDEKTKFVSKMEREYTDKIDNLNEAHKNDIDNFEVNIKEIKLSHKLRVDDLEANITKSGTLHTEEISKLTKIINQVNTETKKFKSQIDKVKEGNEKLELENQKRTHESSEANSSRTILLDIIKDIERFKLLTVDKKVEKLILANIAWNQIDDVLNLEKGYTQKARATMKLPNINTTTDEMILREIHRVNESDIPSLLKRFHDLNEDKLTIKINKLLQEDKINIIKNTKHYYITAKSKSILNLK